MKNIILSVALASVLMACEKKEPTPAPTTPVADPIKAISVLNDNVGYNTVFDSAHSLGGVYNNNKVLISDFTLENNVQLNVRYYTSEATQQSPRETPFRFSINIVSNQFVPLPVGVDQYPAMTSNVSYDKVYSQYLPYTNIFSTYALKYGSFGYYNNATFGGDINAGAASANPIGDPDYSFRQPQLNSGGGFGYYFTLSALTPTIGSTYTNVLLGIGSQAKLNYFIGGCFHEVYTGNGVNELYAIGLTKDTVKVFKLAKNASNNYTASVASSIATKFTSGNTGAFKHYSTDGKKVCLCIKDGNSGYNTYSYDFSNNQLSQNLNQATLEYSGTESDLDMDDNANLYYTGFASNGSNTNGVSVYQKSGNNSATLVGTDNFLKSGTVVKLRYLSDKVFMAVTAKQSGKEIYQISIIKQN